MFDRRSLALLISSLGHDVEFARDIGLASAPDRDIAAHAQKTRAAIITRDIDFSDIRRYPPEQYDGIVVLRLPDTATAPEIVAVTERFIREPAFVTKLSGRLAIVENERVRFRPPLT